jgi:DNA (cytosine-5)-methyltransferase 3A
MKGGINVLSLFDGMSCGRIVLERAGIKVNKYFASEVDKYAIQVSTDNYPDTVQVGSVTELTAKTFKKRRIDLLIGGSPCQSFSRSGDGSGFDGSSKLFWEYVRVLKELREVNPNIKFLLENVVMKKEWEAVITKELDVSPLLIDSKPVSAQKRQRLYWTNIEGVGQPEDENINLKDILTGDHEDISGHEIVVKQDGKDFYVKNGTKKGYLIANEGDSVNLEFPKSKTRRGRVGKKKTNTLNTACNYGVVFNNRLVKLNITELERLQNIPDGNTSAVSESQRRKMIGNGWTVDVIAHIFEGLKK